MSIWKKITAKKSPQKTRRTDRGAPIASQDYKTPEVNGGKISVTGGPSNDTREIKLNAQVKESLLSRNEGAVEELFQNQSQILPKSHVRRPRNGSLKDDSLTGTLFLERYKILRKIGEGGMGSVYEGLQIVVNRHVAIKVMQEVDGFGQNLRHRFTLEAQAISRLRHPNTIVMHDFGQASEGLLFLVMEYLDGVTLEELLHDGPLPWRRCLKILRQILASLGEAHELGIIHRDIKPGNIFLTKVGVNSDFVKVLDFGVAKIIDPLHNTMTAITLHGAIVGSPQYMSPEHINDDCLDARSDIYSVGAIGYELLSGFPLFETVHDLQCLISHLFKTPEPLNVRVPDKQIPEVVEALIMRMLSKDREVRPKTAYLVIDEIDRILQLSESELQPYPQASVEVLSVDAASIDIQTQENISLLVGKSIDSQGVSKTKLALGRDKDVNSPNNEIGKPQSAAPNAGSTASERKGKVQTDVGENRVRPTKDVVGAADKRIFQSRYKDKPSIQEKTQQIDATIEQLELLVDKGDIASVIKELREVLDRKPDSAQMIALANKILQTKTSFVIPDELHGQIEQIVEADKRAKRLANIKIPGGMVLVSGCEFESHYNGLISIPDLLVDITLVTNAQYAEYLAATRNISPPSWIASKPPRGMEQHPIVDLTIDNARKYADWKGCRLPTSSEWEFLARSPDGRAYPWGNEFNVSLCHQPREGVKGTCPVSQYLAGASKAGCLDLLGNVWEWTELSGANSPRDRDHVWVFGGSFQHRCVGDDGKIARIAVWSKKSYPYIGFRCVQDIK